MGMLPKISHMRGLPGTQIEGGYDMPHRTKDKIPLQPEDRWTHT